MQQNQLKTMSAYYYHSANRLKSCTAQLFNEELYNLEDKGELTWQEMNERIEAIACGLLSLGIERQERAAIMSASSPYWTQVDVAVINTGACLVTIYPTLSVYETTYIINDSDSRYLFVGNEDVLARVLPGLNQMPSLEKIIVLDRAYQSKDERIISLEQLMELGRVYARDNFAEYEKRWQENTLDDWATIIYTSGTTGLGKGVILTHWCFASRIEGVNEYFARYGMTNNEDDLTLSFLPLAHIFDRGSCQWMALVNGASIAYADSPATIIPDMQKYNPTWFNCVPRLYEKIYIQFNQQLADSPAKKKLFDWAVGVGMEVLEYKTDANGAINMSPHFDVTEILPLGLKIKYKIADKLFAKVRGLFGNRFRYAFSASAAIAPDLLRFFYALGFPVIEGYGSTESTNACLLNQLTACKPGYVGPAANGSTARIAPDGELEIGSAGIFIGYLNKPEENAVCFTEDGYFKTGDMVEQDQQGYYKIVDRKKSIICLATGKNIAPAKIENLFSTSAAIEQIFVIGDERNYISILVVPDYNFFIDLFEKNSIDYDREKLIFSHAAGAPICVEVGEDFIAVPLLQEMIAADIEKVNARLEEFEVIRRYTILTNKFTEERGEFTPTQKTKKKAILSNYVDAIDSMYAGKVKHR